MKLPKIPFVGWVALGGLGLLLVSSKADAGSGGAPSSLSLLPGAGGGKGGESSGPALAGVVPPPPTVGTVAPVYVAPSFQPTDNLQPSAIGNAQQMTVRQIQAAMNALGCTPALSVNGQMDQATERAIWDFQYLHQLDNPSAPLNVTGQIDQLTQNAIQAAYGKKTGTATGFY